MYNFKDLIKSIEFREIKFSTEEFNLKVFWTAKDLQEFLRIINDIYKIFIAGIIAVKSGSKFLEQESLKKILSKTQIKELLKNYSFKDILSNIDLYVPEEYQLRISRIESHSPININFEGIGKVISTILDFLKDYRHDKIDELLRLDEMEEKGELIRDKKRIIEAKLKKKLIKEEHKYRKMAKKHKIIINNKVKF